MIAVAVVSAYGNWLQHRQLESMDSSHAVHDGMHSHVDSDFLQSCFIVGGGMLIFFTGWHIIDPLLSVGVSVYMIQQGSKIIWKIVSGKYQESAESGHHHHH